jgi:hypothetical protein
LKCFYTNSPVKIWAKFSQILTGIFI